MKPIDIKHAIQQAGWTQIDIARDCQVTPSMVYLVIQHRTVSAKIRRAISRAINRPVESIWPRGSVNRTGNSKRSIRTGAE